MTDYIVADGETDDLELAAGDTALVGAGTFYYGRLLGDTLTGDPILATISGTMDVDLSIYPHASASAAAVNLSTQDPLAAGHGVIVSETGEITARRGILVTGGTGGYVENHGTITDASDDPLLYDSGSGVLICSDGGSVWNTGTIEIDGAGPGDDLASYGIAVGSCADVTVRNDGTITSTWGVSALGTGHRIHNTGQITGSAQAVNLNGEAGSVVNTGELTGGWTGVWTDGTGHRVLNFGTIATADIDGVTGGFGPGVLLVGWNGYLRNEGTISSLNGYAVNAVGANHTVINNGTLSGGVAGGSGYAFVYDAETHAFVESWVPGEDFTLVNTGLIETANAGDPAVWIGSDGTLLDPDPVAGVTIVNSGTILGAAGASAAAIDVYGTGIEVVNTGHIGVQPGGGGTAVLLHGGDAQFRNAGTVQGDVEFGDGADTYDGTGGVVAGIIRMGLGADTATGGGMRDVILGGGGDDVLSGAGGADILAGQAGADRLDGGAGDDLLIGGAGADVFVFGLSSGDDVIADAGAGDRLELRALGALTEAEVLAEASDTADGVLIDLTALGGDGSVLLAGLALGELGGAFLA